MSVPDSLRGRHGAFLMLAGAAALLMLLVVLPFAAALVAQHDDIADLKSQIEAEQAVVARRPQLEDELRVLRANAATVPGLVSAGSAALAQSSLQSEMATIVAANRGTLVSAQLLPVESVRGFDVVAIRYDLTLPLSRLRALTYAVETHTPYYFIDDADLLIQPNWTPDNPQAPDPTLEVRWTVRAYHWSGRR
ncbi:MAG: hypothetical protein KGJ78_13690 [Alphaproteobacteria bacterium]|nr:hypothetical protein [Alphaproteobacteria bacterium]